MKKSSSDVLRRGRYRREPRNTVITSVIVSSMILLTLRYSQSTVGRDLWEGYVSLLFSNNVREPIPSRLHFVRWSPVESRMLEKDEINEFRARVDMVTVNIRFISNRGPTSASWTCLGPFFTNTWCLNERLSFYAANGWFRKRHTWTRWNRLHWRKSWLFCCLLLAPGRDT